MAPKYIIFLIDFEEQEFGPVSSPQRTGGRGQSRIHYTAKSGNQKELLPGSSVARRDGYLSRKGWRKLFCLGEGHLVGLIPGESGKEMK